MKIIFGDDDRDDIELFQEALGEVMPDAKLITAQNGKQVLAALQQFIPDVIFLDINMPEMNGWECLRIVKNDASLKVIPVVIYSTSSSRRDIETARELDVFRLITKPDRYEELVNMLTTLLGEVAG